ncbi:MAG: SAM-dependent methyltransferase [Deltaproteobacteria bacterium]|nr:SAM-dependent methyltransferase [Deltaproteobacteria bacterium]
MQSDDILKQMMLSTIAHYSSRPLEFWEGTRTHDVSQNLEALCRNIPKSNEPITVLDFGCGPGRDLKCFMEKGYIPIGLDGCLEFCEMARDFSGCEVLHQNFIALDLPQKSFHGIFANASLFHIHRSRLLETLITFHHSLIDDGVVFCSNPRGPNIEQMNELRYGNYMDVAGWSEMFKMAGFEPVEHYFRPHGLPREQQPWLAMVWKKS